MTPTNHSVDVVEVEQVLAARAGLDFTGSRGRWLRHFLSRTHPEQPGWARHVVGDDSDAFALLCDAATVQESFFFREPAALDLMRENALPDLRRHPGRVRVWSAGCAAGEEAYTLGMMLFDAGLADRAHVLGTDIAPSAVRAARTATYGRWSMRGVDEHTVRARFRRDGASFTVVAERCAEAGFERHNLFSSSPPSGGPFHLVLCRNVLIYLTQEAVQHVSSLLVESLVPGGWLVTGVSDPSLRDVPGLEPVAGSRGTMYRRACSNSDASTVAPSSSARDTIPGPRLVAAVARPDPHPPGGRPGTGPEPRPRRVGSTVTEPLRRPRRLASDWQAHAERALLEAKPRECERLARLTLDADGHSAAAHSLLVRALASEGRRAEAMSAATAAVHAVGQDSGLRSLHAALLLDEHRLEEARMAARQAVFLDPDNAHAHLVLARASQLLGDPGSAARASRIGQRILQRRSGA